MNTLRTFIRLAVSAAGALALVAVVIVAGADPAAALDLEGEVTLPIGWGPVIVGAIVSILTHLTTKVTARPWVRVAVAAAWSAVAAIALQLEANGWTFVPEALAMNFLVTWILQLLLHLGLIKPAIEQSPAAPVLLPKKGVA